MQARILIRSSLSRWPMYTTGFVGVLFLIGGVGLALVPNGLWFGVALAVVGLILLGIAFVLEANRVKQLMWLTLEPGKFTVTDNIGERHFNDDDIVSIALQMKENFSNGNHVSSTRHFRVWVVSQADRPELIEMKNTVKLGQNDAMLPFVDRVVAMLKKRAADDKLKNLSILGEGWEYTSEKLILSHPQTGESETPIADIVAVMYVDDKLKLWRRGDVEAFAGLPLDAANAHLLGVLLEEELRQRVEEKEIPIGQLGRIVFERKGNKSLANILLLVGIALALFGCISLLAYLNHWGKKKDEQALMMMPLIMLPASIVLFVSVYAIRKMLFRCHQFGVYKKSLMGEFQLLYSEVDAFSYSAVKNYHKGSYIGTTVTFSFFPRAEVTRPKIVYSTSVKNMDRALDELCDTVAEMIGSRIVQDVTSGKTVTWTDNLVFEPTALRYKPSGFFSRQPEQRMNYQQVGGHDLQDGTFSLFQRGKPKAVMTESSTARNFFPGLYALDVLLHLSKQAPNTTTTRNATPLAEVDKPADPFADDNRAYQGEPS
jgi:hypothetical protein